MKFVWWSCVTSISHMYNYKKKTEFNTNSLDIMYTPVQK